MDGPNDVSRRAIANSLPIAGAIGAAGCRCPRAGPRRSGGGGAGPRAAPAPAAGPRRSRARSRSRRTAPSGQRQRDHDRHPRLGAPAQPADLHRLGRHAPIGGVRPSRSSAAATRPAGSGRPPSHGTVARTAASRRSGATNHIGRFAIRAVLERLGAAPRATASPTLTITVYRPVARHASTARASGVTAPPAARSCASTTLGVANRTLPCGTPVAIYYDGRTIIVPVIDRGPYANGADWDLTDGHRARARHHGHRDDRRRLAAAREPLSPPGLELARGLGRTVALAAPASTAPSSSACRSPAAAKRSCLRRARSALAASCPSSPRTATPTVTVSGAPRHGSAAATAPAIAARQRLGAAASCRGRSPRPGCQSRTRGCPGAGARPHRLGEARRSVAPTSLGPRRVRAARPPRARSAAAPAAYPRCAARCDLVLEGPRPRAHRVGSSGVRRSALSRREERPAAEPARRCMRRAAARLADRGTRLRVRLAARSPSYRRPAPGPSAGRGQRRTAASSASRRTTSSRSASCATCSASGSGRSARAPPSRSPPRGRRSPADRVPRHRRRRRAPRPGRRAGSSCAAGSSRAQLLVVGQRPHDRLAQPRARRATSSAVRIAGRLRPAAASSISASSHPLARSSPRASSCVDRGSSATGRARRGRGGPGVHRRPFITLPTCEPALDDLRELRNRPDVGQCPRDNVGR